MKKEQPESKDRNQKIKHLKKEGKYIIDLLNVDVEKIDDQSINSLYDLFESRDITNDSLIKFKNKSKLIAQTALILLEAGLDDTKIDKAAKDGSTQTSKKTIINAVNGYAQTIKNQAKKSHNFFFDGVEASGIVHVFESIIEFRKKIDVKYPGVADTLINAASNSLVFVIGVYSPRLSQILSSVKAVDKIGTFLKVDNLSKTVNNLNSKFAEIKKDKQLSEIYKLGLKIGELSNEVAVPVDTLQKIGFNLSLIDKAISQVKTHEHSKEFVKYLSEVANLLPSTKAEVEKNSTKLKDSLLKLADESSLKPEIIKNFKKDFENNLEAMEKLFKKSFDKDKTIFEKVLYGQEANKLLSSTVEKFKNDLLKNSHDKEIVAKFTKKSSELLAEKLPRIGNELLQKAKKAPIIAKELGLNIKVEVKLSKNEEKSIAK